MCNITAKYVVDYFQSIKCCLLNLKSFLSLLYFSLQYIISSVNTLYIHGSLCNNGLKNQLIFKVRKVLFVPHTSSFLQYFTKQGENSIQFCLRPNFLLEQIWNDENHSIISSVSHDETTIFGVDSFLIRQSTDRLVSLSLPTFDHCRVEIKK